MFISALGLIATVADQPMELFVALIVIGEGMGVGAGISAVVANFVVDIVVAMRLINSIAVFIAEVIHTKTVVLRTVARSPIGPIVLMGDDGKGNAQFAGIVAVAADDDVAGSDLGIVFKSGDKIGEAGQFLAVQGQGLHPRLLRIAVVGIFITIQHRHRIGNGDPHIAGISAIVADAIVFVVILMVGALRRIIIFADGDGAFTLMLQLIDRTPTAPFMLMLGNGKGDPQFAGIVSVTADDDIAGAYFHVLFKGSSKVCVAVQFLAV